MYRENIMRVMVKEKLVVARIGSFLTAIVLGVFTVLVPIYEGADIGLLLGFGIPTIVFLLLGITINLFIVSRQVYTIDKVVQIKGNKVTKEILWDDVESVDYCPISVVTMLFSFIHCGALIIKYKMEKNGVKQVLFHYSKKEIEKIVKVLPDRFDRATIIW